MSSSPDTPLVFYKYQGAGNDFVMIDNRTGLFAPFDSPGAIAHLCDRHFGIGADGLILLQEKDGWDFEMVYFNADGNKSTMCGNGGRCVAAFARQLGIPDTSGSFRFWAADGAHEALFLPNGWVSLKMNDVTGVETGDQYFYLNTGSPHYVTFVTDIEKTDIVAEGRQVRYSPRFQQEGTNVNFVQLTPEGIIVATYERGVEDETLSCGTGVTAAALAAYLSTAGKMKDHIAVSTKGGNLEVRFQPTPKGFKDIWLNGPAVRVFSGEITNDELRITNKIIN